MIDNVAFAKLMLSWGEKREELDDIEAVITQHVLKLQSSQSIGHTEAKYLSGRRTFGYEQAGKDADSAIIEKYTATVVKVDWKAVCEEMGVEVPVIKQSDPSVKISLKA